MHVDIMMCVALQAKPRTSRSRMPPPVMTCVAFMDARNQMLTDHSLTYYCSPLASPIRQLSPQHASGRGSYLFVQAMPVLFAKLLFLVLSPFPFLHSRCLCVSSARKNSSASTAGGRSPPPRHSRLNKVTFTFGLVVVGYG